MTIKQIRTAIPIYALKNEDNILAHAEQSIDMLANGHFIVKTPKVTVLIPSHGVLFAVCDDKPKDNAPPKR